MADMDEQLFDPEHAFAGLMTLEEIAQLETEFGAAKVDEWCAEVRLLSAATALRQAAGLPVNAPAVHALHVAEDKARAGDLRTARAVKAFLDAAADYEAARIALAELRSDQHRAA